MHTDGWLLLHYRFPHRPTARRVYAWRKLRALGAMLMHDSVWTLPDTPRTREQLVWLAAEITERGGEAFLWHGALLVPHEDATLRNQFAAAVEMEYHQVLEALTHPDPDLRALSDRYARARRRDYFQSPLGSVVRDRLLHYGQENA